MFGLGFRGRARASAPLFDPTTLAWDGYFRAPYTGSPLAGTASAGPSGSRSMTEATNPPTAGPTVNGYAPARFNGSNQKLTDPTGAASDYLTTTEGVIVLVFAALSISGGTATSFDNPGIISTIGGANVSVCMGTLTNDKIFIRLQDAVNGQLSAQLPIALNTQTCLQIRYRVTGGPTAEARTNGGTWTPLSGTLTGLGALSSSFGFGRNWNESKFGNLDLLEAALAKAWKTDTDLDNYRGYVNGRYSVAV